MKIEKVIGDYNIFLDKIFLNLENAGFDLSDFEEIDHLGYRVETIEQYEEVKKELFDFSQEKSEVVFNGRLISVLKLKEPLKFKNFMIECIELLAPKETNKYRQGLEHAEFVTKSKLGEFFEKYKNMEFNLSAYGREINPELIVDFEDCAVKFHEESLWDVRKKVNC